MLVVELAIVLVDEVGWEVLVSGIVVDVFISYFWIIFSGYSLIKSLELIRSLGTISAMATVISMISILN